MTRSGRLRQPAILVTRSLVALPNGRCRQHAGEHHYRHRPRYLTRFHPKLARKTSRGCINGGRHPTCRASDRHRSKERR
jgi:hypothetical protein